MNYTKVDFSNLSKPSLYLIDGEYNFNTCLTLFGKNVANFGPSFWTNILRKLENYSNATPPENALEGQLWYDSQNNVMKINTGKNYDTPVWVEVSHEAVSTDGLLEKIGGTLHNTLEISGDILNDNHAATVEYVNDNAGVTITGKNANYQYNIMDFNKFITINGVVRLNDVVDGKIVVMLPKVMKNDTYAVTLSSSTNATVTTVQRYYYYVTDKRINSFTIVIDKPLLNDAEIDFCVMGFAQS
jgi:hypothetical protein